MSRNIMAGNFILFIIIMHAVFSDSMSTASDELHNRNSDPSLSDSSRNYVLKHLLRNFFSRRVKRSPQWHQSLLVQGLSRPFCNLFGGNTGCTINPSSNVQSNSAQCAVGYRYDYSTQRCRQIQYESLLVVLSSMKNPSMVEKMISPIRHILVAAILTMVLYQSSTGRTISNSNDDSFEGSFSVDVAPRYNPYMDPNNSMFDPDASGEDFVEFNRRPPGSYPFKVTIDWPSDPDASCSNKEISTPYATNAIQTRAQALRTQNNESKQREIHSKEDTSLSPNDDKEDIFLRTEIQESVPELTLEDEDFQLPSLDANGDDLSLLKISVDELVKSQAEDSELKPLFEFAKVSHENDKKNQNFVVVNELLIKKHEDHVGDVRKLIVIPKKFRARIMSLCHENTSGHLGVTKTKDRLARHFFWPKCYKDVENYVRSCDSCQKAGKPNEKKKAPLRLVPIIQEVFSKLNIDAVGPLPTNQNGKRFIITSICLSSKYPDAVPVTDLTSISVTDALLNIFSRTGFPAEIQCDQGTSFVSNLTSEFFESFGIKVCHSSVHHPQSNPVERFHRTIKRILRVVALLGKTNYIFSELCIHWDCVNKSTEQMISILLTNALPC
ncbi:unnamed protein product [Larinioides sclopetarius]|uniref:RNA-directed DNA polymerase n=1 Tax=Larinioides sclopetarius TaxID=280406 RepID=A0AAV2B8F7_9ARAC